MKKILLLCFAVLLLCQVTAFASVIRIPTMPTDEMYIGGIHTGQTMGNVTSIYGEPVEKEWNQQGAMRYVKYVYSPTFIVLGAIPQSSFTDESEMYVSSVQIKDNSLATPSGFMVGMPYQAVVEVFGNGLFMEGASKYRYHENKKFGSDIFFQVDGNGVITEICLSSHSE